MFKTAKECQEWIEGVRRFGDKLDIYRLEYACKYFNHPELAYKTIHIGGTNGKGSTTSFIKEILMEKGYNVGTFTSPYIVSFNERISLNSVQISDEDLIKYTNIIYEAYDHICEATNDILTFFEILTLISFLYFRDQNVDYVIFEVGLGGRLDSTNVIKPIVCGITNIGYDHMSVLGNTLEEIALNKLGIVKKGGHLVTTVQPELHELFKDYCDKVDATYTLLNHNDIKNVNVSMQTSFTYKDIDATLNLTGLHQTENASLAIEIIKYLNETENLNISNEVIIKGLKKTFWPGRMEVIDNVILDGAHNINGVSTLVKSMESIKEDKYLKVVFCAMGDKETKQMIGMLDNVSDEIHFTEIDYERSAKAKDLYNQSNNQNKHFNPDFKKLITSLESNLEENELLLVTGSLYFISRVRQLLK